MDVNNLLNNIQFLEKYMYLSKKNTFKNKRKNNRKKIRLK